MHSRVPNYITPWRPVVSLWTSASNPKSPGAYSLAFQDCRLAAYLAPKPKSPGTYSTAFKDCRLPACVPKPLSPRYPKSLFWVLAQVSYIYTHIS